MRLAIIGATGMVGREIIKVLEAREFPITKIYFVASNKSTGSSIKFLGKQHAVISIDKLLQINLDLALLSAGSDVSKKIAPILSEKGCRVIDNSSFWRMAPNHKLIIPEINGSKITPQDFIISNPNCSTIQLLMALAPLHKHFQASRVVVSTYQSVTGTGQKALSQLEKEEKNQSTEKIYPHQIYNNVLPHCDVFMDNGYTKEEMKLTNETKKILDKKINVVATAARVPVKGGHSESVNISFKLDFKIAEVRKILEKTPGVKVVDDIKNNIYPMPIYANKKNDVFVGRIRRDFTQKRTLNLWIVSDNLRKGAATNTVQIAEYLIAKKII